MSWRGSSTRVGDRVDHAQTSQLWKPTTPILIQPQAEVDPKISDAEMGVILAFYENMPYDLRDSFCLAEIRALWAGFRNMPEDFQERVGFVGYVNVKYREPRRPSWLSSMLGKLSTPKLVINDDTSKDKLGGKQENIKEKSDGDSAYKIDDQISKNKDALISEEDEFKSEIVEEEIILPHKVVDFPHEVEVKSVLHEADLDQKLNHENMFSFEIVLDTGHDHGVTAEINEVNSVFYDNSNEIVACEHNFQFIDNPLLEMDAEKYVENTLFVLDTIKNDENGSSHGVIIDRHNVNVDFYDNSSLIEFSSSIHEVCTKNVFLEIVDFGGFNVNDSLVEEDYSEGEHIGVFKADYGDDSFNGCWIDFQTIPMDGNTYHSSNLAVLKSDHRFHHEHIVSKLRYQPLDVWDPGSLTPRYNEGLIWNIFHVEQRTILILSQKICKRNDLKMAEFCVENCYSLVVHCDESLKISMVESCVHDNHIMAAPFVDLFWMERVNYNSSLLCLEDFDLYEILICMKGTTVEFMMISTVVLLLNSVALWDACLVIFGAAFVKMDRAAIMLLLAVFLMLWTTILMILSDDQFMTFKTAFLVLDGTTKKTILAIFLTLNAAEFTMFWAVFWVICTAAISTFGMKCSNAFIISCVAVFWTAFLTKSADILLMRFGLVETLRLVAKVVTYGDQHDPSIFDFFMEKQVMAHFLNILKMSNNPDVALQLQQTLNIVIQSLQSEYAIYYVFSSEYINNLITYTFDFQNQELVFYYISFLRTISRKLDKNTISLVKTHDDVVVSFPLYSEAIKFVDHQDNMIRIVVRALTISIYQVNDESVNEFITKPPMLGYFLDLVKFLMQKIFKLDALVRVALVDDAFESTETLVSTVEEIEDSLYYLCDILCGGVSTLSGLVTQSVLDTLGLLELLSTLNISYSYNTQITTLTYLYIFSRLLQVVSNKELMNIIVAALLNPPMVSSTSISLECNGHSKVHGLPSDNTKSVQAPVTPVVSNSTQAKGHQI